MQVGAAGNLGVSEPRAVWGKDAPAGPRLLYDEPTGPTVASPVKLGRRDGEDAPRACLGIGFISQGRLGPGVPSNCLSRRILISEICHMWAICL